MTPLERSAVIWWMDHNSTKFPCFLGTAFAFTFMGDFSRGCDKAEGGLGPCWGTCAQLEKNRIRVTNIRSMTLVLETCLLYFPITRPCHHRCLDSTPPLLLFIYSFILFPHSFSKYEHLLWASTIPGARNSQTARGKWSLPSHG